MKHFLAGFMVVSILFACKNNEQIGLAVGSLEFNLTISPLCSVEPCRLTSEEIAKIYANYTAILSDSLTQAKVGQLPIKYNGKIGNVSFKNLNPGVYSLRLEPASFMTRKFFPVYVSIQKNKISTVDISLDTGIR